MGPSADPKPLESKRGLLVPLGLNGVLMLVLAATANLLTAAMANESYNGGDVALLLFFLLLGQFLLNGLAIIICAIMGKKRWMMGFLLSGLLVFLTGLGTCGYSLNHMRLGGH